jgi:hypothetical protein
MNDQTTSYKHHPFETKCRSCQQLIVWFKTATGKRMPVDATTTQPTDRADQLDLKRHISHFATCTEANVWRKPR